jgi:hypothetical protein
MGQQNLPPRERGWVCIHLSTYLVRDGYKNRHLWGWVSLRKNLKDESNDENRFVLSINYQQVKWYWMNRSKLRGCLASKLH